MSDVRLVVLLESHEGRALYAGELAGDAVEISIPPVSAGDDVIPHVEFRLPATPRLLSALTDTPENRPAAAA